MIKKISLPLFIFLSSLSQAHQPPQDINVLFAGQSNAALMTQSDHNYFKTKYIEYSNLNINSNDINSEDHNSSFGGSSLLEKHVGSNSSNYWVKKNQNDQFVDISNDPTSRLAQTLNNVTMNPDLVVWIQGEADGAKIKNSAEKEEYKEALSYVFDKMKNRWGNKVIFGIVATGRRLPGSGSPAADRRTVSASTRNKIQFVRQAQHELAQTRDDVVVITDAYDIALKPETPFDIHYTSSGRRIVMDRVAKSAASYFGKLEPFISIPKIKSVHLNRNNKNELLVEINGAESLVKGGMSNILFSAHYSNLRANVSSSNKISDSLIRLKLDMNIEDYWVLHVANENLFGIENNGSMRIRNEHFLPLSSGRYEIDSGSW